MSETETVNVLDVDLVLVDVTWRDNIYVELTFECDRDQAGMQLVPGDPFRIIELEHDRSREYLERLKKVQASKSFSAEVQRRRATRPIGAIVHEPLWFVLFDAGKMFVRPAVDLGDGRFKLSINITNFTARKAVPNGSWFIFPLAGETLGPPAQIDMNIEKHLSDYSRNFIYDGNYSAYTVSFRLTEDEFRPEVKLLTYQFGRKRPANASNSKKSGFFQRQKERFFGKAKREETLNQIYQNVRRNRSTELPTILFASEQRTRLEGNLKAVHDRMIERGLDKQFNIEQHFMLPESRNYLTRLDQVKKIAASDYLVIDDYFTTLETLKLDKSTEIIQAWHAGVGFKAVGYARFGNLGSPKLSSPHRKYTWAIAGSTGLVSTYSDVFGIESSAVIPTGLPRIDGFLSQEGMLSAVEAFKGAHPEVKERKLILFAPTFRGRGIKDAYYDYERIDFDALYEWCGEDTVVGFRMHHFVTEPVPIRPEHADRFIDLSHYPDGLGLLHSTDVLVSDYSSIIYEFSLLDRPMVFYAYDRDVYAATRGFQQDYDASAPGKVCLSFDELIETLRSEDFEMEKVAKFRNENFDHVDTNSSDRFIDWFFLGKMPKGF